MRGGLRGGLVKPREKRASTKTYDCDSIMWTDDMGVFLKNNTPHSNDDNLSKAL